MLHHDLKAMSEAARPRILKLARRQKLVDECFKEFSRAVFPGAPPEQVSIMRTCFFAGAAELQAVLFYATAPTLAVTGDDLDLMECFTKEIERFHARTIETMNADTSKSN